MYPQVRQLRDLLDRWEDTLRCSQAAGFDTSEALDDLAVLRCLLCLLLAGWPGGREAPFGGTWLCGFPH